MSHAAAAHLGLVGVFAQASEQAPLRQRQGDNTRPFSIRLTPAERARLELQAGRQPLGKYIRSVLLGEDAKPRRVTRRPTVNDQQVAAMLSGLGQSRLSSNVNQLAKAANMGTLEVDENIRQQLQHACAALIAMREALLIALRINPSGR